MKNIKVIVCVMVTLITLALWCDAQEECRLDGEICNRDSLCCSGRCDRPFHNRPDPGTCASATVAATRNRRRRFININ